MRRQRREWVWSTRRAAAGLAVLFLIGSGVVVWQHLSQKDKPLYVGVMLPLSGQDDVGWRQPLEWALEGVNAAGGIRGRPLRIRYADIALEDPQTVARRLVDDDSVLAVIGPDKSSVLFDVAPLFIAARKPLISPSSTSGDVTRAFAGSHFIRRTVESDIGQLQAMLLAAAESGVNDVALLTSFDAYGTTFFDWFGFFATELGMRVTEIVRMENEADCTGPISEILESKPQLLIAVPARRPVALCVARRMQAQHEVDLRFSDGGMFPALIDELGPAAEGLQGMALAADPTSGFAQRYQERFGAAPVPYAANTYDALTLLAYALQRSEGQGGVRLADAIGEVTSGGGRITGWDAMGVASALAMIARDELPDVSGATGDLHFGREDSIDLDSSYFALWEVRGGAFHFVDFISTAPEAHPDSVAADLVLRTSASTRRVAEVAPPGNETVYPERTGLWALIVAASAGWENYRHQADALAQYQLLRRMGVPDERIVLVLADDIAGAPQNRDPGAVRQNLAGPNLHEGVDVDYRLDAVGPADILAILSGKRSDRLPEVIASGPGDNVLVFLSGHGGDQGLYIGVNRAAERVPTRSLLTPESLASTIASMQEDSRYRRLLVALEMCQGGVMGRALASPGALLVTGANAFENSLGTHYAPELDAWLGDEFSVALAEQATRNPEATLGTLYRDLYLDVPGSHVSVYNAENFGSLDFVSLSEFLRP